MHQQHHTTSEDNNLIHDPQMQENTSIPPAPTATHRCNFYKCRGHYASTCEAKRKAGADLRYRIVPSNNMAKIYLDLEDVLKDDSDFYLVTHVDKDDRMRDSYIVYIRICPMVEPALQSSRTEERNKQRQRVLVQEEIEKSMEPGSSKHIRREQ